MAKFASIFSNIARIAYAVHCPVSKIVKHQQKCQHCQSSKVIKIQHLHNFGQVMCSHHSDQMSQRLQVSRVTLCLIEMNNNYLKKDQMETGQDKPVEDFYRTAPRAGKYCILEKKRQTKGLLSRKRW